MTTTYTLSQLLARFPLAGNICADYTVMLFRDADEAAEWEESCESDGFNVDGVQETRKFALNRSPLVAYDGGKFTEINVPELSEMSDFDLCVALSD